MYRKLHVVLCVWPGCEKTYLYASKYSSLISAARRELNILSNATKSIEVNTSSGRMGIWKKNIYHDLLNWSISERNNFLNTLACGAPISMNFCTCNNYAFIMCQLCTILCINLLCTICSCRWTNSEPIIEPQSWQTKIHCLRSAKISEHQGILINRIWYTSVQQPEGGRLVIHSLKCSINARKSSTICDIL